MDYCVKLQDMEGYVPEGHTGTINKTLIDEKMGIRSFIVIHGELNPGGQAEAHAHDFEQGFFVLSGRGWLKIGGKENSLETGSAYCAPAGVEHQIIAMGPEPFRVLRVDSKVKG
jgi:quercetin dioxygenase-like cupin family protein